MLVRIMNVGAAGFEWGNVGLFNKLFWHYSVQMASKSKFIRFFSRRDWRIWLGIILTIVWMAGVIGYAVQVGEMDPQQNFSLEAMGSFLEGVFAPLAFLWLVIGLFIQQRELANNSKALRKTSKQSQKQTQAIAATEMNARQETFFKISASVERQLGGISGMLLVSGLGQVGSGRISNEQVDEYFRQAASGDHGVFARKFLSWDFQEEGGIQDVLYGTEIRERHSRNFVRTFERIRRLARNCDIDGIIEDSLMQNALGLLYLRMIEHDPKSE